MSNVGGCFVVLSRDGLFWNGQAWVPNWEEARQFAGPFDPYEDCLAEANALRAQGVARGVAYVPRAEVAPIKEPRPEADRKPRRNARVPRTSGAR
jgi:hypothetical protein